MNTTLPSRRVNSVVLAIFPLVALAYSVATQTTETMNLVRIAESSLQSYAAPAKSTTPISQISEIFGTVKPIESGPPPATNLQLTLIGSFVFANPKASSALIFQQGEQQHYFVGDEIESGTSISAIYSDRVDLLRGGRIESLYFSDTTNNQKLTRVRDAK